MAEITEQAASVANARKVRLIGESRSPVVEAGITDHIWTLRELLTA